MRPRFAALLSLILLISMTGCTKQQPTAELTPPPQVVETVSQLPDPEPEISPEIPSAEPSVVPSALPTPEPTPKPQPAESTIPQSSPDPVQTPVPTPTPSPTPALASMPILMYHHVVPDGTECNDMTVTESKLAGDLKWLSENGYHTILPSELASGSPLPEKPILITFDDGYRSNYELAFPLLQKYQTKAVISVVVYMQDVCASSFLSWDMCREMIGSGLVEIGSHTYYLHNLGEQGGNFTPGGINGIQRKPEESDADFQVRVLDDLQKSHDLIEDNLGCEVTFFAYPFGIREPDAEPLIDKLFPVTVITRTGDADLSNGPKNMTRWTVSMNTNLAAILDH